MEQGFSTTLSHADECKRSAADTERRTKFMCDSKRKKTSNKYVTTRRRQVPV